MSNNTSIMVTVTGITRRNNSAAGNPAYTIHTTTGDYRTKANTMAAFDMSALDNVPVVAILWITPSGLVYGWDV